MTQLPALLQAHAGQVAPYDAETQIAGRLRVALILMAVLIFGLGAAGALIPIGGAVVGSGQLGAESRVKRIAHPTGGVIAQILVENGQHVKKGQLLLRLDDKVLGADAQYSSLTVDQMLAQKARLEAERLGAPSITFPPELLRRTDASARAAMADEQKLFAIRRAEGSGLYAQLQSRIAQYHQEIAGYRTQIAALRQQSALIAPELEGVRKLYDKKLVTIARLNQLERTAVDINGSIGALNAQIAQTMGRIAETREQMIQINQTRRSESGNQLAQINGNLNAQQVRSVSATDARDRAMIRAPYDGIVDKLAFSTIGGTIRPAETILEIVPDQDALLVDATISPADIDQVHVGQSARIRLSALSVTATPELRGQVRYVAADPVSDPETRRTYVPVRVSIDPRELAAQTKLVLKPGMPAEIFIETGDRSMLSYITKPLRDQLARAFRDN